MTRTPYPREYHNIHHQLRRKRGSAKNNQCVVGDDHPASDWAHVHETDPQSLDNYRPMCRRHHYEYDAATKVLPSHARPHGEEARERMRSAVRPAITDEAREKMRAGQARRLARAAAGLPEQCAAGHDYTPENTLRDGNGKKCRECNRVRCLRYQAQRKAARAAAGH